MNKKIKKIRTTQRRKDYISSKEAMVAAIAHEIKNPLNNIKGASQYLFDKYQNIREVKEFTSIILQESDRLEGYLNEFLSFARGIKPVIKPQNLYNFITGVIMTIKHSMPFTIKVIPEKDPGIIVGIDAEQLRQVLVNLFNNAKDAVKDKKNPEVKVSITSNKSFITLKVKDNGYGISKNNIKKVFEAFYTTKKEGLGIGLAISRTIVRKHGGTITVKSLKNKWTEFTIKLPQNMEVA